MKAKSRTKRSTSGRMSGNTVARSVRTKKTVVRTTWERVGDVGVDSGQLMICDPCYADSEWQPGAEPAGMPTHILNAKGRLRFPELKGFTCRFPFDWGRYDDMCPALGMSINDANAAGIIEEVDRDPVREFSYRGACDVSHLKGDNFGQLYFKRGHAGAGVAFSSGYGDGVYPVIARRNSGGRVVEVRVLMDPSPVQLKILGLAV